MKPMLLMSLLLLVAMTLSCSRRYLPTHDSTLEEGVAESLARYRRQVLSDLTYTMQLTIPAGKVPPIEASERISFQWKKNRRVLPLDFKETRDHLHRLVVNGREVPIVFEKEHILIEPKYLRPGANAIEIDFTAGNLSLNRNEDYLYTLLVPDRARTVFPCFDQPDLKARFRLSLTVPDSWQAVANAPLLDSTRQQGTTTYRFAESDRLSTYLFSFVAGRFERVAREVNGRPMYLYHRETDPAKIRLSLDPLFELHAGALAFLEEYTQVPYPFQKFDFAAIPDFQYNGMEHVGAIQYKASSLFLDEGATRDQRNTRAHLLAHETAHMWFGDLVTMRWFEDVWLKEVFANFMADKITEAMVPESNYDLEFLLDHFPAAYAVDRTEGANPIGQPLENLNQAGTLYGNIIYHKAPIMMRQLERLMGKEALRDGLREYLQTYAYGNATWAELIAILDRHTPADLHAWNRVWVTETGRPQIDYVLKTEQGKITDFSITQKGEDGSARVWPQFFEVLLGYPDRTETLTVHLDQAQVPLTEALGKEVPAYVVFNSSGQGYGLFPVDTAMMSRLGTFTDPVVRAAAYINLYENMLSGRYFTPAQLTANYLSLLPAEPDELNLKLLTGQLGTLFWQYTPPAQREALAVVLEGVLWGTLQAQTNANKKKVLFRGYQSVALSAAAQERLYTIWKEQRAPQGITLTEDDYTTLALALAVRNYPAPGVLAEQLSRIQNADRRKRLQFMMPALSAEVAQRDAFFASLKKIENREREAYVTAALGYLHHPLRAASSARYLPESLELLEEIQRTGDIFFPTTWLTATLGYYQSPEVAALVRDFLRQRPAYNPRLKAKLLQAADGTFRASRLLYE